MFDSYQKTCIYFTTSKFNHKATLHIQFVDTFLYKSFQFMDFILFLFLLVSKMQHKKFIFIHFVGERKNNKISRKQYWRSGFERMFFIHVKVLRSILNMGLKPQKTRLLLPKQPSLLYRTTLSWIFWHVHVHGYKLSEY